MGDNLSQSDTPKPDTRTTQRPITKTTTCTSRKTTLYTQPNKYTHQPLKSIYAAQGHSPCYAGLSTLTQQCASSCFLLIIHASRTNPKPPTGHTVRVNCECRQSQPYLTFDTSKYGMPGPSASPTGAHDSPGKNNSPMYRH